jgi:uncharacterized membrane protein
LNDQISQQKLLRLGFFIFTVIWFIGTISPCFNTDLTNAFYPFQKQIYSTVCHQNINKSFNYDNIPFLVCARCTGIYTGALFSALVIIFYSKQFIFKTKYLIILAVPMLFDVVLLNFGAYNYIHSISAITGILFGSSVFLYILSSIENLLFQQIKE